jgi:hypothetical protein
MRRGNATSTGLGPTGERALRLVGLGAAGFGVATILAGGLVLFGPEAARAAAGRAVPFVLWANFLAGFAYVTAGVGLARGRRWAVALAAAIALGTALVVVAFAGHVAAGGAFEPRTAVALVLRAGLWAAVAAWARRRVPADAPGGP